MSDSALIEAFLEMQSAERGARANTLDAYRRDLGDARAHVKGGLAKASAEGIEAYVAGLAKRGLAPATARRRISAIRGFFRFLLQENTRGDDPTARIEAPKRGRGLPKTLSPEIIARLIDAAESPRDRALIELLYGAGLRVSELVSLPLNAAPRPGQAHMIVAGKGGKERLAARTCARCRCCSATPISPPRKSTPMSAKAGSRPWLKPNTRWRGKSRDAIITAPARSRAIRRVRSRSARRCPPPAG